MAHLGRIETRYVSAAAMLLLQVTVWQRLAVTPVRSIVRQSTNWLRCRYRLLLSIAVAWPFYSMIKDRTMSGELRPYTQVTLVALSEP